MRFFSCLKRFLTGALYSLMRTKALLWLLLGLIAGTACQLQQAEVWSIWAYLAGLALAGLCLPTLGVDAKQPGHTLVFSAAILLAALLFGFSLTGLRAAVFQAQALDPSLQGIDIAVTGRVVGMPRRTEDAWHFRFDVDSARSQGKLVTLPAQIYLSWYAGFGAKQSQKPLPKEPLQEPVQEADAEQTPSQSEHPDRSALMFVAPSALYAGDFWRMNVRLKVPHGNSNPYGFDYELWLWEQGLQATGYVRSGAINTERTSRWSQPVGHFRQSVREAIFERVTDRRLAGVLAALVVGDQNAIERPDWNVFRATGVAHLMSISGLHITMFAWLAAQFLAWFWRNSVHWTPRWCLALPASSAGAWGGLLLACAYAIFSGWGLPAQRTIWMLAVVVLLRQSGVRWPWHYVWLLAMAVVVLFDPWALLQAGFWLSFVAVGVLLLSDSNAASHNPHLLEPDLTQDSSWVARRMRRGVHSVLGRLYALLREQWVVTLALTPLSLLLFNQVSLVSLLANAVAIPWVTFFVTPLALFGVAWPALWDVAAYLTGLLTAFLQFLASWPWASIGKATVPWWCAVAGIFGGALCAMRLPWYVRLLGCPFLLPVILWSAARPEWGQFVLLAPDVGQGNAVIVQTAQHSLLYDAGPRFSRESDAGHRVLVPLLRALDLQLDQVVISHRDADHAGGAAAVLSDHPQAALSSSIEDNHELQILRRAGRCKAGQRWAWDGVDFEFLHPLDADYEKTAKSNAMSCVLRISNGAQTALLTGDIEQPQEQELLARGVALQANFLLAPHHGSNTSSSSVFLNAVKPRWVLVQAGYRNRYGHPAAKVMQRYHEQGLTVVQSAACGAASWSSSQPQQLRCQRQDVLRYWHHRMQPE